MIVKKWVKGGKKKRKKRKENTWETKWLLGKGIIDQGPSKCNKGTAKVQLKFLIIGCTDMSLIISVGSGQSIKDKKHHAANHKL